MNPPKEKKNDSAFSLWAPVPNGMSLGLWPSWFQSQWIGSFTLSVEEEDDDGCWMMMMVMMPAASPPSPKLMNQQKCLPIGHARERLGYVLLLSVQTLFQNWKASGPVSPGKLLKGTLVPKRSFLGSVGPSGMPRWGPTQHPHMHRCFTAAHAGTAQQPCRGCHWLMRGSNSLHGIIRDSAKWK